MGVFDAFFGCIGDGGFTLACISGCRGVIGFKVGTWLCSVREKVRPARSAGGCEREKVRPAYEKWPKIGVLWRVGRTFSRKHRWMGRAGRTFSWLSTRGPVLGEFFRGAPALRALLTGQTCPARQTGPAGQTCPSELVLVPRARQALGAHGGDQPVGAQARQRHPHDAHRDPTERRHGLVEDAHRDEELQGRSQVL